MANYKSDIVTAKDSVDISDKQHSSGELTLTVNTVITLKTAMTASDTIQIADLPAGAILVPQLSKATCIENPGTAFTIDIGDAGDVDRYADGLALTTAGEDVFFTDDAIPAAVGTPYRPTEMTRIFATVMTATSITEDARLVLTLTYRIRG